MTLGTVAATTSRVSNNKQWLQEQQQQQHLTEQQEHWYMTTSHDPCNTSCFCVDHKMYTLRQVLPCVAGNLPLDGTQHCPAVVLQPSELLRLELHWCSQTFKHGHAYKHWLELQQKHYITSVTTVKSWTFKLISFLFGLFWSAYVENYCHICFNMTYFTMGSKKTTAILIEWQ